MHASSNRANEDRGLPIDDFPFSSARRLLCYQPTSLIPFSLSLSLVILFGTHVTTAARHDCRDLIYAFSLKAIGSLRNEKLGNLEIPNAARRISECILGGGYRNRV